MALNNINSFVITPTEKVQLILGTNGSGKSSLVRMLTPLPPEQSEFLKDGSKVITISKDNIIYTLKHTFSPVRHSFVRNGDELNHGGTISVFKELVKQEFGITPEIHDLLTDIEVFHSMSPARRREWFTRLSDTSYDYALTVFGRLKERNRDVVGALKLAKKHLVVETAKVITETEEAKLKHDVELTLNELNLLIQQSAPLDNPISFYEKSKDEKLAELTTMSNRLLRMKLVAPYGTFPYGANIYGDVVRDEWGELLVKDIETPEDIDAAIEKIAHDVTVKETMLSVETEEHDKIVKTIDILVKTGNEGVEQLRKTIQELNEKKLKQMSLNKLGMVSANPESMLGALETVGDTLDTIAVTLPSNADKRFNQTRLTELTGQLMDKREIHARLTSDFNTLEAKRAHLESHKNNTNIECPKCKHVWIPGFSDDHLASVNEKLEDVANGLKNNTTLIEELEHQISELKEYGNTYRSYLNCVRNWPVLQPLWDYLTENETLIIAPMKLTGILNTFKTDLLNDIEISKMDMEIQNKIKLAADAEELGDVHLSEMQDKLNTSTLTIESISAEITKMRNLLNEYKQYKRQIIEASGIAYSIKNMMADAEKVNNDLIEMIRRDTLNHCVRQLQNSLALKESSLQAAMIQKGIVTDLEKQIEKLSIEDDASKVLMKQLSPTEGLIAEGLLGFIKYFINQMNLLIKKIWSYPLQIQDCSMDDGELDYKFGVYVGSKHNPIPDVKVGSTGIREVIDTAFKITAVKCLKLGEYPLYLDEFGHSFDTEHRAAAMATVNTLMESNMFSQLFMINHHYSSYGSFSNAEVCVLDATNVVVPKEYNTHVVITH